MGQYTVKSERQKALDKLRGEYMKLLKPQFKLMVLQYADSREAMSDSAVRDDFMAHFCAALAERFNLNAEVTGTEEFRDQLYTYLFAGGDADNGRPAGLITMLTSYTLPRPRAGEDEPVSDLQHTRNHIEQTERLLEALADPETEQYQKLHGIYEADDTEKPTPELRIESFIREKRYTLGKQQEQFNTLAELIKISRVGVPSPGECWRPDSNSKKGKIDLSFVDKNLGESVAALDMEDMADLLNMS